MKLAATQLSFVTDKKTLLDNIDVELLSCTFNAIIGPNGAGKTTLLNMLNGDTKPSQGQVDFNNKAITSIDKLTLAKQRAVLPQLGHIPFAIRVRDIVAMGREPYRYDELNQHNDAVIQYFLAQLDITHLSDSLYSTLSGGEQHRVQIARTLVQIVPQLEADLSDKVLFLDEPTNHLDIKHQYSLMKLLKQLQSQNLTILAVMHDLSLTLQFSDNIILLDNGKKVGSFTPVELVKSKALSSVYKMTMKIRWDEDWGRYIIAAMPDDN